MFKDHITVTDIVEHTPRNSLLAAVVMLALFALKSISVVIYGSALYAASGLLFPLPAAVLVNLMGTVIMVSIPYSVGAANGAEMLENLFRKHPKAAMLKSLRAGSDFFFALLVRLLGVLPGDLVGAYMGASGVKYPAYLAGTVLGMLPSMITFPLMGMNIRRVGSPEFLISAGIQVAMSILSVILYFVLRKKNGKRKEWNMKRIERVLTALLCLALLLMGPVSLAEGETKTATILFTHDMHSHFLPVNTEDVGQSGGYAQDVHPFAAAAGGIRGGRRDYRGRGRLVHGLPVPDDFYHLRGGTAHSGQPGL